MRTTLLFTLGTFAVTSASLAYAYYQKKQFYPSVVFITKSSPIMTVLFAQACMLAFLMGKLFKKIFFGQLRAAEMEHLIEKSWYAVTETCLAFTVFRDDFSTKFILLFMLLLFLKSFHWLAEDRVDYMERSPVISLLFHLRVLGLLATLGLVDMFFVNHAYHSTLVKGASVQLVFGFEYAILLTMVAAVLVKYILHSIDLQSENPWEAKAYCMLYTDLILGLVKIVLYTLFLGVMMKVHTFPLFAIRPMYLTIRAFKKALHDVIMSRRAINNMNTMYPDATAEELESGDNVCIICREDMTTSCKKLPCGHIFHKNCLRSWFQRQQTCPTCRMDVLRPEQRAPRPAAQQQQQQQQQQQPQPGAVPPGFPYGMWLPPPPAAEHQPAAPPAAGTAPPQTSVGGAPAGTSGAATGAAAAGGSTAPHVPPPFMMMPPFPFMPPMAPMGMAPPPAPPADLRGLSREELARMEGNEQRHLAARVQWLRDIHATLDTAMIQIQQYTNMCNTLGLHTGFAIPTSSSTSFADVHRTATTSTSSSAPDTRASPSAGTRQESASAAPSSAAQSSQSSSSSTSTTTTTTTAATTQKQEPLDLSGLEGAVGYTPPSEEYIPEWSDPRSEAEESDEMHEMRRRRLARFASGEKPANMQDTMELD